MRFYRLVSCSLLLGGCIPVLARGQALPLDVIDQINAAPKVRVLLVAGSQGTLYAPRADSTSLGYVRSEIVNRGGSVVQLPPPLPIAHVAEIQVANGSHASGGAKMGGVIGVGVALALFVAANAADPGDFSTGDVFKGTAAMGLLGAALGALIGSGSPRWRTVYTAPVP